MKKKPSTPKKQPRNSRKPKDYSLEVNAMKSEIQDLKMEVQNLRIVLLRAVYKQDRLESEREVFRKIVSGVKNI